MSHSPDDDPVVSLGDLTENQRLFWLGSKVQPNVPLNTQSIRFAFAIDAAIDREHFQRAVQALVDRADSLRTIIREVDGLPRREISRKKVFTVEDVCLSNESDPAAALRRWIDAKCEIPLSTAAPLDSALINLGPKRFVWYFAVHHLNGDFRSIVLLARHVASYYDLSLAGRLDSAPSLPEFEEYVAYERARRSLDSYRKAEAYWRKYVDDARGAGGGDRAPVTTPELLRTAVLSRELTLEESVMVGQLTKRFGLLSPAVVFLSTLFAWTFGFNRGRRAMLTLGTTYANRPERFFNTIGLFVSTCPMQIKMDAGATLLALARKVQTELIRGSTHEYPPVHGKIWNVFFNYLNGELASFGSRPMEAELIRTCHSNNLVGLEVRDFEGRGRFTIDLEFQCEAFPPERQLQLADCYFELLRAFLSDPECAIAPLLEPLYRTPDRGIPVQAIPRRSGKEPPCLSYAQQQLWLRREIDPTSVAYNTAFALRLRGVLHPTALAQSLNEVVRRHDILRTVISQEPSGLGALQRIMPHVPSALPVDDLESSTTNPLREATRIAFEEAQRTFDFERGPLIRWRLLRLGPTNHVLVVTTHNIVCDVWSTGVFQRELLQGYEAFAVGRPPIPPALTRQFADFACWQRARVEGGALANEFAYWKEHLDGVSMLELPTDRPRPAVPTSAGADKRFVVSADLAETVHQLSRKEGVTPFMTLFAVFNVLLNRQTRQEKIVVGVPITNRTSPETECMIGCFANMLALATDVSGDPTFREVLARVRSVVVEGLARNEVPFSKVVETLHPASDLHRSPILPVVFVFPNGGTSTPADVAGLEVTPFPVETRGAKFDFSLEFEQRGLEFAGHVNYRANLFDAATLERFIGHFETLLRGAMADPDIRVSALPLLTAAERHQLLVEWNQTNSEFPSDKCLQELVEEQVERSPEAVAVVFEGARLTYRELNRRSNQLAHKLRARGVGPDTLVGVCMDRSVEMVVALLGVIKAGGAYVPLDPESPQDRLDFMIEDSRPALVLTQERLDALLSRSRASVLHIDADWKSIGDQPDGNPPVWVTPIHLAYGNYTSGSTGKPKCAVNTQRGLVNLLSWMQGTFALDGTDAVLQKTPSSFDVATSEFFWPLISGARLVVARPGGHRDIDYLLAIIEQEGITTINFVPSQLQVFVEESTVDRCVSLKRVFSGGEALAHDLQERFFARHACELHNLYGPTEVSIWSSFWTCQRRADDRQVPIGRPIANTHLYILDSRMQPVPIGVPGELYIGGVGLARGYHNRPELTLEKFIPNPLSTNSQSRLYRTGDVARYRPDGAIEYLGRTDHQVKIRGVRIELSEIENVLSEHKSIREAIVLAREDRPGDKRLVAYLVSKQGFTQDPGELLSMLKAKLPDVMVPTTFVWLDALPLNPNGKVDRGRLAAPDAALQAIEPAVLRNPVEQLLASIWSEVLGHEGIGPHDDFFALGGHSLLAALVISRIRRSFGVELPVSIVFQAKTIEALAGEITAKKMPGVSSKPLIPRKLSAGPRRLSFAQERLWFLDRFDPRASTYNIPVAFVVTGPLDVGTLARCFTEIVSRHEALRTTFETVDDGPIQVVSPPFPVEIPLVDLSGLAEPERDRERDRQLAEEANSPFDLEKGPLLRVKILRLGPAEHLLLWTVHHVTSDGWSNWVLVQELRILYEAFSQGMPSPLPDLQIQYADFAQWQRQWLTGYVLELQIEFWRNSLKGAPALLDLPLDRPRPAIQKFRGARKSFELSMDLTTALKRLSRQEDATLFMTFLATFNALLRRYTNQDTIVVGSPIANRTVPEIEGLIGFFVNVLALPTDLSGDPTFGELLARVRETTLDAYSHQDVPFEKLVTELNPQRSLSHSPIFQVMMVLQSVPRGARSLAAKRLQFHRQNVPNTTTKFDLLLELGETDTGMRGSFEYNTDLFEGATIDRLCGHFKTLLRAVVATPEARISALAIITEAERHQLLVGWNNTRHHVAADGCLHELLEAQVERTPDAIAVTFEGASLTYRELNCRANQLAHRLRSLGVGPDVLVGICMDRSLEMVVALLGVLKAGGAYVPLDPEYPRERLAFMLQDSKPTVLITQERLKRDLPAHNSLVLCAEDDTASGNQGGENLRNGVTADHVAYGIFTSGSTGRPKCALNTHRGIVNLVRWMQHEYLLTPADRVLQKTNFSFDISVTEFFWPLSTGARLVLAGPGEERDPVQLIARIAKDAITTINFVPSMLQVFLETSAVERCGSLKRVMAGGEALPFDLQERFFSRMPAGVELHNLYGPTEAAVYATSWACTRKEEVMRIVPIGRPIANVQTIILDSNRQLVPIGVPGELFIGGVGLARGYLDRPELNADKFVQNPFGTGRLYRTGDLARYRPDGVIEYLGRVDDQAKIRGFRIELGEISIVLCEHPSVRDAVVTAREDAAGDKQLVAYVVPRPGTTSTNADLREHLKLKLPQHMIPSVFVSMDKLPLNSNGKLDRRALPSPTVSISSCGADFVAPRDELETRLMAIWEDLLSFRPIGVDTNFFDIGGHSLLAAQIVARIGSALGIDVPLRAFFAQPTIASLARDIVRRQSELGAVIPSACEADFALMRRDALLDPSIVVAATATRPRSALDGARVILTGATGFLGGYLLLDLLRDTTATICCLVRAQDTYAAMAKIRDRLASMGVRDPALVERIVPVLADLSKPGLGINDNDYARLAETANVIYHCGATVNHLHEYARLRNTNVLAVQEVIRLACATKVKPIHYISTLFPGLAGEDDDLQGPERLDLGYAQTKWVGEQLAIGARERNLPTSIYRPGFLSGHSITGDSNRRDAFSQFIVCCIKVGSIPDCESHVYLTPVDYVSRAIIHFSSSDKYWGRVFHLATAEAVEFADLIGGIRRSGYNLDVVDRDTWLEQISRLARTTAVASAPEMLSAVFIRGRNETRISFGFRPYCESTERELAGSSIRCPRVSIDMISRYVRNISEAVPSSV